MTSPAHGSEALKRATMIAAIYALRSTERKGVADEQKG
jgi:hypothetical protein